MKARYRYAILAALAAAVLVGGSAVSQTSPPAEEPATTTRPAPKIEQPASFLALAEKARKLGGVYVRGAAIAEAQKDDAPPELRRIGFEMWAQPPSAKLQVAAPVEEVRVTDGQFVYAFWSPPGEQPRGRRRQLTPANYYHALETAAVLCDAANGYQNLAAGVKFLPIHHESKYAKGLPKLEWFRAQAATEPPHHLVAQTKEVTVGIDPKDGLMRVLVARIERDKKETTVACVLEEIRRETIDAAIFRLPAAAARAQWTDAETGGSISTPQKFIAPR